MKNYLLATLLLTFSQICLAQFSIDLGGNIFLTPTKKVETMTAYSNNGVPDTLFNTFKVSSLCVGLFAYPKYHFLRFGSHDLSIGAPISAGINPRVQNRGESSLAFMYDANISFDLNGGKFSRSDDYYEKYLGYYVGVCYGLINTNGIDYSDEANTSKLTKDTKDIVLLMNNEYIGDKIKSQSSGFTFHAGIALPFLGIENKGLYNLRIFVRPAISKNEFTYFGGGFFYAIGSSEKY